MPHEPGDISKAIYERYRIQVHAKFFPYEKLRHDELGTTKKHVVHATVDHGARAIFCSQEWFDALPKVPA